jgi:hypothetical protein
MRPVVPWANPTISCPTHGGGRPTISMLFRGCDGRGSRRGASVGELSGRRHNRGETRMTGQVQTRRAKQATRVCIAALGRQLAGTGLLIGPRSAIEGRYPCLLAVRALASCRQVLWCPVGEATAGVCAEANALSRPPGASGPRPDELWAQRRAMTAGERAASARRRNAHGPLGQPYQRLGAGQLPLDLAQLLVDRDPFRLGIGPPTTRATLAGCDQPSPVTGP